MKEIIMEVGSKVQRVLDDVIQEGTVLEIKSPKTERPNDYWRYSEKEQLDFITWAKIEWNDNKVEEVNIEELESVDSDLERDFRLATESVSKKINAALKEAEDALEKAVSLSEEHGIPFYSSVSFLGQPYIPATVKNKFPGLDKEFMTDVSGVYSEYGYEHGGWERSAVC